MKHIIPLFGVIIIFLSLQPSWADDIPTNFSQAKKRMASIYVDHQITSYCGCKFNFNKNGQGPGGKIAGTTCGYDKLTAILHWEHIVPASRLGSGLSCWKSGHEACVSTNNTTGETTNYKGRKCCRKVDVTFRQMEADLINLVPVIGELNMARSNYNFTDQLSDGQNFGTCDFKTSRSEKLAQPPKAMKGFIARTYLKMAQKWQIALTVKEQILYKDWDESHAETAWETTRAQRIDAIYFQPNQQLVKIQ